MRAEAARDRFESTSDGLKQIATSTGLRDELNLRRAFVAHFGISPRDYRKQAQGKSLDKTVSASRPKVRTANWSLAEWLGRRSYDRQSTCQASLSTSLCTTTGTTNIALGAKS
jgi:AraC-like DNA-binding protein